jgi:hypothetical protein
MSSNTIFHSLGGGGMWDKLAHKSTVVKIAILHEFDANDRFFTTSCDPYRWVTDFILHISPIKGHKEWLVKKMPEVKIKLDKLLKD